MLPTVSVARARLAAGIPAFELVHEAGLAESRTEARKLIKGGMVVRSGSGRSGVT